MLDKYYNINFTKSMIICVQANANNMKFCKTFNLWFYYPSCLLLDKLQVI